MGVRSGILDGLVKAERKKPVGDGCGLQGHAIVLPEPEPSANPVDGAVLLDEIVSAIQRYVVLPLHAARACACWVVHTFLAEHFLVSPRLSISSPTKGCGKTTLLDVLYRLVLRPLLASNVTPAAVFRVIEKYKPCLLIDEADTFLGINDELRGILNSGHRKGGAVLRVTGDDLEPRQFATFAPCGIALIGTLPPTLADRSIPVELNRRRPNEPVEIVPSRQGWPSGAAGTSGRAMGAGQCCSGCCGGSGNAGRDHQPRARQLAGAQGDRHRSRRQVARPHRRGS